MGQPAPLSIAVPCHVSEIFCYVIAVFLHCSQLCSKGCDFRSIASSKQKSTYTKKNIYCTGIRSTVSLYCFIRTVRRIDLILAALNSSSRQTLISPCRSRGLIFTDS
jgi:hypothetical protein